MTEISEEPTDEQQEAIDALDRRSGFNPNPRKSKTKPKEEPLPVQKMASMEEWSTLVKKKYDNLEKVVKDNLPSLWLALEFVLTIRSIMNIAGVTLPWFGIILGRASSLKTAAIEILRDTINTFYTDIFTPKAFVSNSTTVSKDKLVHIDMLPKVKNKLFLVSELSSMFTKKEEEVQETLGIFTRLADGHGLQTNTGAHGSRGYRDIYFNMVAAAVDIPYKVYKLLGYLGPKLYFIRLPKTAKTEDQYLTEMYADEYPVKFGKVREALNEYLNVFASCLDMEIEEGTKLSRIPWTKEDDRQASRLIVRSALLLSHLRAVVMTFGDSYGHGGTDYAYATAQIEEPSRAITQLRNLARGHALSKGRTHVTMGDIPIIIKVALSTAPIDRVNVFDLLIAHKGKLTTTLIEDSLNMSPPTARKTMTELKAIELVDIPKPDPKDSSHKLEITLKETFKWFLTPDFDKLREGFIPEDNSEEMKAKDNREPSPSAEPRPLKEKSPPCPIEPETKPKPSIMEECSKCGVKSEPFYMRIHQCEGTD